MKKGISLMVLVITVIVILIISGFIIVSMVNQGGMVDSAKKATFMSDFRNVESGVNLYSISKIDKSDPSKKQLPTKGKLSLSDKQEINNNVPTLKSKIEELNVGKTVNDIDLYWIDNETIGIGNIPANKKEKGYIIDATTMQIYDYVGDTFEGKRWHTLDGGVVESQIIEDVVEMWDGWIKLTLYYPASSTAREWRLGDEGEVRLDPSLMWQAYNGPITVPLDRTKDVWIKYKLNDKVIIIPPVGTLLVDIEPDSYGTKVSQVNININYDDEATTKEYRVGNSGWMTYTGPFVVTENCMIEARAKKNEKIYNTDGTLILSRDISGKDLLYVGNIGNPDDPKDPSGDGDNTLPAPTITRLAAQNSSEVARVLVTYPAGANRKIYKVNYRTEENYTTELSVKNYGEYIIAYYYDVTGKKSLTSSIYINDTTGGTPPMPPAPHDPLPPKLPGDPPPTPPPLPPDSKYKPIPAPTINVSTTSLVEQLTVSVTAPSNANKIYIKLGRYGTYEEYTGSIIIRDNMEVYSYYRTYTGEKSEVAYKLINNIKKLNKPYVAINADPYPWSGSSGASKVIVSLTYTDVTKIEYSEDGLIFKPYTSPFEVTQNKRVYARGTNLNGVTETYLDITNIGKITPPIKMEKLAVNISVNPEPVLSTTKVAKSSVTIEYDEKATEKYYRINATGELLEYTAPFEVTTNCTVYAYAKSTNGKGEAYKIVDNLLDGISNPIITQSPTPNVQSSKVSLTIQYDKYATIKRYSIDGGPLRDYGTSFDVIKNGTLIYAYSENVKGQKSEATYKVNNIVADPPVVVISKDKYYILKLSYPKGSAGREYKWKETGIWTTYKDAGIILVKPEYKNDLIQNGALIKLEDESGNLVTFTGDYYLVDVPISELSENIFMRWDRITPSLPQIIVNPTDPSKTVDVSIIYSDSLVEKKYKVVNPDGTTEDWKNYVGPIKIDRNNTIIYAKGMDDAEVWSAESIKKIINIDENPPVIKLTADLVTALQRVSIKVNVTDDVEVGKVKGAPGTLGESYFASNGTEIPNNSIVNISSNGYYTFYAEDKVGNTQVYTLNIENVDLTPPVIDIQVNPENTVGIQTNVTINYGDSTTKQYKVGTSNATWTNYTTSFNVTSNTVLSNNWQNADGSVTIFAKGKDSAGNEVIVQRKILNLDLDKPKAPVINSNSGYPILTSYGVTYNKVTTITYDNRTDIDNYYSIDNGATWKVYTGQFDMLNGTVIAKSVKKNTGLDISVSKTIAMPADALRPEAYDGTTGTYATNINSHYLLVDASMQGKLLSFIAYNGGTASTIVFLNASNQTISSISLGAWASYNNVYTIPINTTRIRFDYTSPAGAYLYEVGTSNEPTFSATNGYMLLTADPTKAIREPYKMLIVNYFATSVQRLYRIGTTGDWLEYKDQPIKVNHGQTLYAKGIDKDGYQTRVISSYTVDSTDALKKEAFDGNTGTSIACSSYSGLMLVDESMVGKSVNMKFSSGGSEFYIRFLNSNNQVISSTTRGPWASYDENYTIPSNTKWIKIENSAAGNYAGYFTEISAGNEPTFAITNGYMLIHEDALSQIREPYQMVTINYFTTSVQRLYRIGTTGDWLSYNDKPIKVNQGQTIYAKGIDQYGNVTRIVPSLTANVADALTKEGYDNSTSTYVVMNGVTKTIQVDPTMYGKKIRLRVETQGTGMYVRFIQQNLQEISNIYRGGWSSVDEFFTIPTNTKYIKFEFSASSNYAGYLYDVQVANEPTYTATNGYMLLHADPTQIIREAYQMVTVNYFATSAQKLYRIGTTGDWLYYNNQPIKVNHGQTLYAKGIDTYGNETRVISSYTPNVTDALKKEGYDGNTGTYILCSSYSGLIQVDSSMIGKNVNVKLSTGGSEFYIRFLNSSNQIISTTTKGPWNYFDESYTVPANTKWIKIENSYAGNYAGYFYEITPLP